MPGFRNLCVKLITPPLTVLDVGAAGVQLDLGELNGLCELHAFEPRADASAALADNSDFAKVHVHNIGLAAVAGRQRLYVTKDGFASSLRKPNIDVAKRYLNDSSFEIASEAEIECTTLADFAAANAIRNADYIKLDTQGSELDILRGAGDWLDRISIIKSEIEFVELYHGQSLFEDMTTELSARGFRFVDFEAGQRRGPRFGKQIWADVVFARKSYGDRQTALRAATIFLALGFMGEAVWLLQDLGIEAAFIKQLWQSAMRQEEPAWIAWLREINHTRREQGKMTINGPRIRKLIQRASLGMLE